MIDILARTTLLALASGLIFASCSITKEEYSTSFNSQRLESKQELLKVHKCQNAIDPTYAEPKEVLACENWMPSKIRTAPRETILNKTIILKGSARKAFSVAHLANPSGECDELILYGGEKIKVKVLEINDNEIKYKKCDNLDGPTYTISKSNVKEIQYANGTDETITESSKGELGTIGPLMKNDYAPLWIWSLVGSAAASIIGALIIVAGAATGSVGVVAVTLLLGGLFLLAGSLLSIAFLVFFVCWLLKLVS